MALHHKSMRKYTAALLDFFNDIEVEYTLSTGETRIKKVPLKYTSREKSQVFDEYTQEQLLSGNTNVLPRATLSLITLNKAEQRTTNKNTKVGQYSSSTAVDYMYNSVPYEFSYDVIVKCRGMNEATQIIEQIAPKFNPTVNIDVWDASNLSEATRIPVRLESISLEDEEFDELTSNIMTVTISVILNGNLYQPIKTLPRVKEFQMYINRIVNDEDAVRENMLEWDVDNDGNVV